jgi:hypothetical protein
MIGQVFAGIAFGVLGVAFLFAALVVVGLAVDLVRSWRSGDHR